MNHKTEKAYLKNRNKKGIALLWTAIMMIMLILFMGIGIDFARVYLVANQLQNAADAAALAGAQLVKYNQNGAIARAVTIANANYAAQLPVAVDPSGEVILGRWVRQLRQFFPTTISPNAVKVLGSRPGLVGGNAAPAVALIFGPIVSVDKANVSRFATAVSVGSTGSGIITYAKDPTSLPGWNKATGLLLDGGGTIDLRGKDPVTGEDMVGDVQINATSTDDPWDGFRLNGGSADIYAGEFNVVGSSNPAPDDTGAWQKLYGDPSLPFSVNPKSAPVQDPLADLTPPDISTMAPGTDTTGKVYYDPATKTFTTITGGDLTLNPGYYPGGINMSTGNIVLNPGVYAFGGGAGGSGMVLGGTASLIGTSGVMCYVTGDPLGTVTGTIAAYGQIDMHGTAGATGKVQLTSRGDAMSPPQINGEMGVAIWQDRNNTNYGVIGGGADTIIKGVIYCVSNAMKIAGNPEQAGNQLIVGALEVAGKVSLGIAYDGRNTIEAYQSYLVE